MQRKAVFMVLLMSVFILSGCKTFWGGSKVDSQIQGLQNQVSVMEIRLQENEKELSSTQEAIRQLSSENATLKEELSALKKKKAEAKEEKFIKPTTKQVQIALGNAGFNPGPIDGRMGVQTRNAIRAFQKANNLTVDGEVAYETWKVLRKLLYEKKPLK